MHVVEGGVGKAHRYTCAGGMGLQHVTGSLMCAIVDAVSPAGQLLTRSCYFLWWELPWVGQGGEHGKGVVASH